MALPSARRPAFVEEEFVAESQVIMKVKVNKLKVFLEEMDDWCKWLSPKALETLTLKKLKKRAIYHLMRLRYDYDKLPKNWVSNLIEKYDLKFVVRKKKKSTSSKFALLDDSQISVTQDPLTMLPGLRNVAPMVLGNDEVDSSRVEVEENNISKDADDGMPPRRVKKFLDFTKNPPPKEWLKAFAEGKHLPRELKIYSNDDLNILYYNYDPKYQDQVDQDFVLKIHDANSFKWWKEEKPDNTRHEWLGWYWYNH